MQSNSFSPTEAIGFGWKKVMQNKKFWIIAAFMMFILGNSNRGSNFSGSDKVIDYLADPSGQEQSYQSGAVDQYRKYVEEVDTTTVPLVPERIDSVLGVSDQLEKGNMIAFVALFFIAVVIFAIPLFLMSIFISAVIQMGFIKLFLAAVREKEAKYELILSEVKFSKAVTLLVANFLYGLLVFFGFLFFVIPGIYFGLKYIFVTYSIVDKDSSIGEAFDLSSNATKGNKLNLLALGILAVLINIAGFLVFIYGLVITIPVTSIAYLYAYHKLTGGDSSAKPSVPIASTSSLQPPVSAGNTATS